MRRGKRSASNTALRQRADAVDPIPQLLVDDRRMLALVDLPLTGDLAANLAQIHSRTQDPRYLRLRPATALAGRDALLVQDAGDLALARALGHLEHAHDPLALGRVWPQLLDDLVVRAPTPRVHELVPVGPLTSTMEPRAGSSGLGLANPLL